MATALLPPGPKGHFLSGSLPEFSQDRLGFFTRCAREYGAMVAFRLGRRLVYLLNDADAIEYVLVTGSRNFTKHFAVRMNRLLTGYGLIGSEGDFWLRQRRLIQPAFLRERVASYGANMVAAAERRLAAWQHGATCDMHVEMAQITLEIVAEALFGADVTASSRDVGTALEEALRCLVARMRNLIILPEWLPTPTNLRLRRAVRRLDAIVYGIIKQRRLRHEKRNDLLSLLLHARDEDGSHMTDQQLRDETMTLFLAGHETTALALTWTWYLLAQHPEVEAQLLDELQRVLGGRTPTAADLPRLRYTERVIQEVMRLYPPVYAIGREAIHDCEIGGYHVPAGTTLLMSQWVMHRNPRYFAAPEVFNPDRWTEERAKRLPKYAYFPFGGGPRVCIGNTFALLEAVLVLATLLPKVRFAPLPDHPVRPRALVTLRPEYGIKGIIARRAIVPRRAVG
jgi:cytochrome P450